MDLPSKRPITIKRVGITYDPSNYPVPGNLPQSPLTPRTTNMANENTLHMFLLRIMEVLGCDFMIEGLTWDGEGRERVTMTIDTIPRGLLIPPLADLPSRIRAPGTHEVSTGRFTWAPISGMAHIPVPGNGV